MGANLLMTVILGAVFVALVLWVAVRLRAPRRRDEELGAEPPGVETRPTSAAPPTPMPEFDAADLAAADAARSEPEAPPEPATRPETVAQAATEEPAAPDEPAALDEPAVPPEPTPPPASATIASPPEPEAAPPAPERQARIEVAAQPAPKKKRSPRKKRQPKPVPRPAQPPGTAAIVHDAYRNIRTWTTSLTPGRALPAILTDPRVERGEPTTYRFKLKQRPYAIVKTDLTEDAGGGVGPLVHEKVQLLDDEGTTLFEMSLLTSDIGSDETPGEITTCSEGPWLDDFRELNALSSKDSKRIGTDFRKKFRAKEQVRLKRDFGV